MLRSALIAKLGINKPKSAQKKIKSAQEKTKIVSPKTNDSKPKSVQKRRRLSVKNEGLGFNVDAELLEFEEKHCVKIEDTKKAVEGVITLTSNHPKLEKMLFADDQFPIFLQINSIKVPKIHTKILRIPLKHSILAPDSEVCLIVPDVKGIPNKNHEEHCEHYEKLLSRKGVNCVKKIMTFHELRTEYETFELKNKLVELYDIFLVDGRIGGKTVSKCGKIFYKKRKVPTSVKLQASNLKGHIDQSLKKTPLYLHGKSDSFVAQIGHSKMPCNHLVENVFSVLKNLDNQFFGGFGNVRGLNLFTFRGITIPIYSTLKNKNEVSVPQLKNEKIAEFTDELSTKTNTGVTVKASGEVTTFRLKGAKKYGNRGKSDDINSKKRKLKESNLENGSSKPKKPRNKGDLKARRRQKV